MRERHSSAPSKPTTTACARVRGMQSLIACKAGRPHEAIRYAQQGAVFAHAAHSTAAVWLAASEARAWGQLGNANQALDAIDRAERAWEHVQTNDFDELGGICLTSRSEQLYYAADALISLPEGTEASNATAAKAEWYSGQAVEAFRESSPPEWDFECQACSHTAPAVARIRRGQPDGAAEALAPVLELPPEFRVNGVIQSVRHVHLLAARDPELQEELATFVRTPLPALSR